MRWIMPLRNTVTGCSSSLLLRISNFLLALTSKAKPTVVANITATKMPNGSSSTPMPAAPVNNW